MSRWWPLELTHERPDLGRVVLRPLRRRDRREWRAVREANVDWLREWESTLPQPAPQPLRFGALVRTMDREGQAGRMLPFVIDLDGRVVGQMHLFGITWGSLRSAAAGYWVSEQVAGRGIAPLTLAMLVDYAINGMGLHRVEVNIRPDNTASLSVVAKLGFRDEGVRARYLHINGAWHDHRTFALTAEDLLDVDLVSRVRTR
ncbi:MAG TPA: GNAT family protein [Segeticoccus sp.]|uniref:GNAT family N-acetyltransferase n=1 Tax=Segeticoccus sp. TaxID=2706531 RepID=UPI002D7EEA17|nr:GNAT family protein [Segeticoccus sp.]HET8600065.1 GNAT family protein [Segeticoccus sp.]